MFSYFYVRAEIPVTTAARICVSFIVAFSYPLQCNPARRSVLTLLKSVFGKGEEPSLAVYRIRYTAITVNQRHLQRHFILMIFLFCPISFFPFIHLKNILQEQSHQIFYLFSFFPYQTVQENLKTIIFLSFRHSFCPLLCS